MKDYLKILLITLLLTLGVSSCAIPIVKQMDKMFLPMQEQLDSLEQVRRTYRTGSVDIANLKRPDGNVMRMPNVAGDSLVYEQDSINYKVSRSYNIVKSDTGVTQVWQEHYEPIPEFDFSFELLSFNAEHYPDSIIIRAVVYDESGRYISGLAPESDDEKYAFWSLLTDSCRGVNSIIPQFEVTEFKSRTAEPHAIAFVLDHSPSMGHQRALLLQQAVARVVRAVKPHDWISLIKFTREVMIEVPLTNDSAVYRNDFIINGLRGKYRDGTAIYDGGRAAVEELNKAPDSLKKVMILFTDGEDNLSNTSVFELIDSARTHDIKIHTIAYGLASTDTMRMLARETGGSFYHIFSSREFPFVFADIYLSLNNYYKITYLPPECAGMHYVNLELSLPQLTDDVKRISAVYDKSIFSSADTIGTVVFFNIEFEFGKYTPRRESMEIIRNISATMQNNPDMRLLIVGHTDDIGSAEYNLELSEKRALAVREELVKLGVSADRLETKGYGKDKPIVPNDSDENRRMNRRTEFVIIAR